MANKKLQKERTVFPLRTTEGGKTVNTKEEQWKLRYHRVGVALDALATPITEQTVFKVKI